MNELAGVFDRWCRNDPDRDAYVFVTDRSARVLSRRDLATSAHALARELREEVRDEVIVVEGVTSAHAIVAIWACVLADACFTVIPPAHGAGFTAAGRAEVAIRLLGRHVRIDTSSGNAMSRHLSPDRLATPGIPGVLQLTSGTTGEPSYCHIPYPAVAQNLAWCTEAYVSAVGGTASSWLPLYHDMGLFGGVMWAASSDGRTVMMSPLNFLRRPMTWLDQIDEYKVAATLCPSFVLHQFNRLLTLRVRVDADLRTLRHLIVGAEPISASEARQFITGLEAAGLRPDSFHACFGLAEMTLIATSKPGGLVTRHIAASPQSEPVEVVSLGRPVGTTSCHLDNPPTGRLSMNSPSQTVWTSKLGFIDESAAISTGDLAAIIEDELYVFGRWDDTLTVNGQRFSASVLESAVRGVAGANDAAVVRINGPDGPICAVVEVDPEAPLKPAAIQEAIARATGVMVSAVVPVHRLPRTSSGKVRRVQVRDELERSTRDNQVGEPG